MVTFEETHKWLHQCSLKTDKVKNELMHFTKTKIKGHTPIINIQMNTPGVSKDITALTSMQYLGLHFDPQLKFHEHAKITASKASQVTEALRMLGNLTRGLNQMHLRCIYLAAILLIATYGSIAFWDCHEP